MRHLEQPMDPETLAALDTMLPFVPRFGWTRRALEEGLRASGRDAGEALFHFPGGAPEMVEAFFEASLARALAAAGPQVVCEVRLSKKVRALVAAFLQVLGADREATRRACGWLMLPGQARHATRITARIVDAIWETAGDSSEDFAWYTKRASLGAILLPTLLFWLSEPEGTEEAALAFFERRLSGIGRIGRLRARLKSGCSGLRGRRFHPSAAPETAG